MEHKDLWLVIGLTIILAIAVSLSTIGLTGNSIFAFSKKAVTPIQITTQSENIITSLPKCVTIQREGYDDTFSSKTPQQVCDSLNSVIKTTTGNYYVAKQVKVYSSIDTYNNNKCNGNRSLGMTIVTGDEFNEWVYQWLGIERGGHSGLNYDKLTLSGGCKVLGEGCTLFSSVSPSRESCKNRINAPVGSTPSASSIEQLIVANKVYVGSYTRYDWPEAVLCCLNDKKLVLDFNPDYFDHNPPVLSAGNPHLQ